MPDVAGADVCRRVVGVFSPSLSSISKSWNATLKQVLPAFCTTYLATALHKYESPYSHKTKTDSASNGFGDEL